MKDDKTPQGAFACFVGAALFMGWALLKMTVIGYYPDEVVVQIAIPFGIGAVLGLVGKRIEAKEDEEARRRDTR